MAIPLQGAVIPAPPLSTSRTHVRMLAPFRFLSKLPPGGRLVKGPPVQQQQPGSLRWALRDNRLRTSQQCQSSISFNNSGDPPPGFSDSDEDYIDSSIIEGAVQAGCASNAVYTRFFIKMRDGNSVEGILNSPNVRRLEDYAPQPAIVLKMEDGSDLLLPILVSELPSTMLMDSVRLRDQVIRPTVYQDLRDVLEVTGFQAKFVRITRKVGRAYYARVYLNHIDDISQKTVSLAVQASDAINLAVRCKIPIQVNKQLAYHGGVRLMTDIESEAIRPPQTSADSCAAAEEFALVRNMTMAAIEERYSDAARLRDELSQLRSKNHLQQKRIKFVRKLSV